MSSNCPPQLQLTIQPNTTSFKRSFEQFGFDLESPVGSGIPNAGGSGPTNASGNERNKRARSASSFDSETSSELSSDSIASRSSGSSFSSQGSGGISGSRTRTSALSTSVEPPRLPTPQLQDVEMPDYPEGRDSFSPRLPLSSPQTHVQDEGDAQHSEDPYRLTLERFNMFDREISLLRQSEPVSPISTLSSSSSAASAPPALAVSQPRLSPTPPPTLPPLAMNRHRLSPGDVAFFRQGSPPLVPPFRAPSDEPQHHTRHTTFVVPSSSNTQPNPVGSRPFPHQNANFRYLFPEADAFSLSMPNFDLGLNLTGSASNEALETNSSVSSSSSSLSLSAIVTSSGNDISAAPPRFRERLDSALERLRSISPLVPGLDGENVETSSGQEDEDEAEQGDEGPEEDEEEDEHILVSTSSAQRRTSPPTLPPIPAISDDPQTHDSSSGRIIDTNDTASTSTRRAESRVQSRRTYTVPPNPPILPPIPTITATLDSTERAWDRRAEFFTDHFDELVGLGNSPASPSTSNAPRSVSDGDAELNPNLGDTIPSPMLRDLHTWIADRRPTVIAEDNQSISSISTSAATAGTEREAPMQTAAATTTTPAPSSSSSSSSTSIRAIHGRRMEPTQERLERFRERRLDEWLPDIPSPSAFYNSLARGRTTAIDSRYEPSAPSTDDREFALLTEIYGASSPALSLAGDAFWAPLFSAAGDGPTPSPSVAAPHPGAGPRPSYYARQSLDDYAVRSLDQGFGMGIGFGDRPTTSSSSASAARMAHLSQYLSNLTGGSGGSTVAPSDTAESRLRRTRNSTDDDPDLIHTSDILPPFNPGLSTNPSSDANNSNSSHMSYNSVMRDAFRISQPPALNLHLTPNGQSSRLPSMTSAQQVVPPPSFESARGARYRRAMQGREADDHPHESRSDTERGMLSSLRRIDESSILESLDNNGSREETSLPLNHLFGMSETQDRARSPARSTLSNWDGGSSAQAGSRSQAQPPTETLSSTVVSTMTTGADSSRRPTTLPGFAEPRRGESLYFRNRIRSYHAQTRPVSSNSLVTESASEARRRADFEQLSDRASSRQYRAAGRNDDISRHAMDVDEHNIATDIQVQFEMLQDLRRRNEARIRASDVSMGSNESGSPSSQLPSPSTTANASGEQMDLFDSGVEFPPLPSLGTSSHTMSLDTSATAPSAESGAHRVPGPYWMNRSSRAPSTAINTSIPARRPGSILQHDSVSPTYPWGLPDLTLPPNSLFEILGEARLQNTRSSTDVSSGQRYPNDAPSLPHPDLGNTFVAQRHSSTISSHWRPSEDDSIDIGMDQPSQTPTAAETAVAGDIDNDNEISTASATAREIRLSSPTTSTRRLHEVDRDSENRMREQLLLDREQRYQRSLLETRRLRNQTQTNSYLADNESHNNATAISAATTTLTRSTTSRPSTSAPTPTFSRLQRPRLGQPQHGHINGTMDNPGIHTYFSPETFTPGPFRNTMQHVERNAAGDRASIWSRSTTQRPRSPPLIPPLSFDEDEGNITLGSALRGESVDTSASNDPTSGNGMRRVLVNRDAYLSADQPDTLPNSLSRARSMVAHDFEARLYPTYRSNFLSTTTSHESDTNISSVPPRTIGRRPPARSESMHRFMQQQARAEAAALEDPDNPLSPRERGSASGIDPLRPNGFAENLTRSHQLVRQRQREQQEMTARRRALDDATENLSHAARTFRYRRADGANIGLESIYNHRHGAEESSTIAAGTSSAEDDDDVIRGEAAQRTRIRRRTEMAFSLGRNGPGGLLGGNLRRGRFLSDYIRDEDMDMLSYESLLSLGDLAGEAKPRATPTEILEKMKKGVYKDWATEGSDTRCPICLDDYEPTDPVQKLTNCSHWLHQECLNQWLQSGNTCPVCRCSVGSSTSSFANAARSIRPRTGPFTGFNRRREQATPLSGRPVQIVPRHFHLPPHHHHHHHVPHIPQHSILNLRYPLLRHLLSMLQPPLPPPPLPLLLLHPQQARSKEGLGNEEPARVALTQMVGSGGDTTPFNGWMDDLRFMSLHALLCLKIYLFSQDVLASS